MKSASLKDKAKNISYATQWDKFYASLPGDNGGKALWDVEPELAAKQDFEVFSELLGDDLPLVDFGCGTGAQTEYLSQKRRQVIGIDVSQKAVDMAANTYTSPGVSFIPIDEGDPDFFYNLHNTMGDMNVYMRGVLHQILDEDIDRFVASIKVLMGSAGKLYFVEVASGLKEYFENGPENFSQLPGILQKVFISHLPPRGISVDEVPRIFPQPVFDVLKTGKTYLHTNISFKKNNPILIPAIYGIVAPKNA